MLLSSPLRTTPADGLFNIDRVGDFFLPTRESILTWSECDRQPDGSDSPVLNLFLDEDLGIIEDAAPPPPVTPQSPPLDSGERALQRLISGDIPKDEFASLIEGIFSGGRAANMVSGLTGQDAQTFIDAVDGVRRRFNLRRTD